MYKITSIPTEALKEAERLLSDAEEYQKDLREHLQIVMLLDNSETDLDGSGGLINASEVVPRDLANVLHRVKELEDIYHQVAELLTETK